jgi:hypothetical protein
VVIGHVLDELAGLYQRLHAILFLLVDRVQNRFTGNAGIGLLVRVDFEEAECPSGG